MNVSDSGTYKVFVSISDGVETKTVEAVQEVVINKAQGVIIAETVQAHPYDGQPHALEYQLNGEQTLLERDGLPLVYTEPGTYTVRVYAEGTANYLPAQEVEITIIIAVAVIGDVYYDSLAASAAAARSGDTILVIADTVVDTEIEIRSGVTLRIAYNDDYAEASTDPDDGFVITGTGKIVVKDGGRIIEPIYFVLDSPYISVKDYFLQLGSTTKDYEYIYGDALLYPNFIAIAIMTFAESMENLPREDFPFFPFDTYFMRSILVEVEVEYGGTCEALALFVSPSFQAGEFHPDRVNLSVPPLVTSRKNYNPSVGGLIVLEEGSSFTKEYVGGRVKATINGDAFIGYYPVTINTYGLGTIEKFPFLIPSTADVVIASGELLANNDFILASGATLTIQPGASVVTNDRVIVEEGANFTVNGNLTINGTFVGEVATGHTGAKIIIGENAVLDHRYYGSLLYILYCLKMDIRNWNDPDAPKYSSVMSYNDFLSILQDETDNLNKWILFFAITSAWNEFNDDWGMFIYEMVEMNYEHYRPQ